MHRLVHGLLLSNNTAAIELNKFAAKLAVPPEMLLAKALAVGIDPKDWVSFIQVLSIIESSGDKPLSENQMETIALHLQASSPAANASKAEFDLVRMPGKVTKRLDELYGDDGWWAEPSPNGFLIRAAYELTEEIDLGQVLGRLGRQFSADGKPVGGWVFTALDKQDSFTAAALKPNKKDVPTAWDTAASIQKKGAARFNSTPLSQGFSTPPTAFRYGGHATQGLFSDITGKSAKEIEIKVQRRVEKYVREGTLVLLAEGELNKVYQEFKDGKPTGTLYRIGIASSTELQEMRGLPNANAQLGAPVDFNRSLFVPKYMQIALNQSSGFAVLAMLNVGTPFYDSFPQLTAEKKLVALQSTMTALAKFHMLGRTHNDLHLENILLNDKQVATIIDPARTTRGFQRSEESFGDLLYVANEMRSLGISKAEFKEAYRAALLGLPAPGGAAARIVFERRRSAVLKALERV
jgi:hypothetical protein